MIAETPNPPYYAVIFTSARTAGDNGYQEMAELMARLAGEQVGFLGIESAREGVGITVSYWRDLSSIQKWREHVQHTVARNKGRSDWYSAFKTRIAVVERDYGFAKDLAAGDVDE
jgi:heme-degrading monooxygenase HmoA